MDQDQRMAARAMGLLAQDLSHGYVAFMAAREVFQHPTTELVRTAIEVENTGPAAVAGRRVARLDGTEHYFSMSHFAGVAASSPAYREVHDRLWLSGALLALGDALAAVGYLDRKPDLEFVRHLRNGVAHGNSFNLARNDPRKPAHFSGPDQRLRPDGTVTPTGQPTFFEIAPSLDGTQVLYHFMGPGDVLHLLMHLG